MMTDSCTPFSGISYVLAIILNEKKRHQKGILMRVTGKIPTLIKSFFIYL